MLNWLLKRKISNLFFHEKHAHILYFILMHQHTQRFYFYFRRFNNYNFLIERFNLTKHSYACVHVAIMPPIKSDTVVIKISMQIK